MPGALVEIGSESEGDRLEKLNCAHLAAWPRLRPPSLWAATPPAHLGVHFCCVWLLASVLPC